jgi:hypothetical protein
MPNIDNINPDDPVGDPRKADIKGKKNGGLQLRPSWNTSERYTKYFWPERKIRLSPRS